MEYYSAMKRDTFQSVLMSWMNLEPIVQSEVSQKEKDKYCMLTHVSEIQKDGIDEPVCRTATGASDIENRLANTVKRRGWDELRE